ncbi:hypothetical protein D047_2076B, partial [Vibrio parahaemolyticus VPTS-2010_2]|jgi:hypothetical protein
MGR